MFSFRGQKATTENDLAHVNQEMYDLEGSCWVHERTIYIHKHSVRIEGQGYTQRLFQLFALVTEDGNIAKVQRILGTQIGYPSSIQITSS